MNNTPPIVTAFLFITIVGSSRAEVPPRDLDQTMEVRGTIVDAASKSPIAARVHVQSEDGSWHLLQSSGGSAVQYNRRRSNMPNSPEVHTTLSAHPFVAKLPPGEYTFRVERGKEYLPSIRTITVSKKPVSIQFALQRWINMAKRGWYSGDTHVHRSLDELPNVILAEDVNVALPLTYWVTKSDIPPSRGNRAKNTSGNDELIQVDKTHVIYPVNTEYEIFRVGDKRHTLGAVFILNHKHPFPMGAPPVAPIARMARTEGALLDFDKHSWEWSLMIVPIMNVDLFELSNNHVWQTNFGFENWTIQMVPDYMNIKRTDDGKGFTEWGWIDFGFKTYYALLNSGFRMRVSAGTASGVHPVQLGFGRVYVHLPNDFSYDAWINGLNAGNSFVSTGPMIEATFNSKQPGHTFSHTSPNPMKLHIHATASSKRPLQKIEILLNGEVASVLKPANRKMDLGGFESKINEMMEFTSSGWIAVRCFEDHPQERIRFAHTNPVFVDVPGKPLRPKKLEVMYFIDRVKEEIKRNESVLSPDALMEYRQALAIYEELLKLAN